MVSSTFLNFCAHLFFIWRELNNITRHKCWEAQDHWIVWQAGCKVSPAWQHLGTLESSLLLLHRVVLLQPSMGQVHKCQWPPQSEVLTGHLLQNWMQNFSSPQWNTEKGRRRREDYVWEHCKMGVCAWATPMSRNLIPVHHCILPQRRASLCRVQAVREDSQQVLWSGQVRSGHSSFALR